MAKSFRQQHVDEIAERHRIAADRESEQQVRRSARAIAIAKPGHGGAGCSSDKVINPARQHMVDLRVGRSAMIEKRIEIARQRANILGKRSG